MVPGPPLARSGRTTLRPTTSLALRSRKQLMPRDFSSGAWSRKPQRGPEANFVEPIEDCKHNRKRQNSRDYESAIESAFIDFRMSDTERRGRRITKRMRSA